MFSSAFKWYKIGKYHYYIGITEHKQVKQDNMQQVSRIYLHYSSDGTAHFFYQKPLLTPTPVQTDNWINKVSFSYI